MAIGEHVSEYDCRPDILRVGGLAKFVQQERQQPGAAVLVPDPDEGPQAAEIGESRHRRKALPKPLTHRLVLL